MKGVIVLEQLLDEIDVGHDHTATAVTLEAELVHGIAISLAALGDEVEVALPKVAGDLQLDALETR